ncbi:glyoxylate/hydroxypyruvate reductase A [uncultured Jannaschia sp.]|uniref:2-hydroxyacid dehydrogenase n=1 Tax=uncultured Jannaschia sp. TaxID=293347 RepID=UPI002635B381|nr:glyoxylate/hydroxypyruvate reductase A [uncultured Jannaschia sp.]
MSGAPARILFAAKPETRDAYRTHLPAALDEAGIAAEIVAPEDEPDPAGIDWIVYGPSPATALSDFAPYTNLKGCLSLWAGVETVEGNRTLAAPLTRMVDDGLTQGMVEWVTGHVLRHHLGMDAHIANPDRHWTPDVPPLARDRAVAVLGLGVLGTACAQALSGLGFDVTGWSRGAKDIEGVRALHGADGLEIALRAAEIVVLLLPHTRSTESLMNADRFALMRPGAVLLNPGRGALVDEDALLAALDGGLGHATLDTFRTEPLPREHPFWTHPKVTVTPHIASATRPASAARVIAENVRRGEAGLPLLHLVDRSEALA